ncbi:MFS transporter [Streptomyces sp. NPDC101194]|uniref:MFS transporter n=1 Tax=Streptomyces sp. NPDC101194 TaxID=3366127 RepID=UPI0038266F73
MPNDDRTQAGTPRTAPAPDVPFPACVPEPRDDPHDPSGGPGLRGGADGDAGPPGAAGGAGADVPGSAPGPGAAADGGAGPGTEGGYRAVFRVREFRAVFAAHLLSLLGVVVSELALTVLVYDLTGSPLLSALTFALGLLPYLVGGTLFAGVADRYPARRVLVVCDLVCACCVAVMVLPGTPVGALLALRCAVAAVAPVFSGTRTAALADILGEGDLYVLGRSLLRIVSQSALLAGFGVGGALLAALSPRGAITVTVGTFCCSALLLRFGTRPRPARLVAAGEGGAGMLRDSLAGARAVFADRGIRALLLLFWVPAFFVVAPEALAAPYADAVGLGPAALGLLMGAMAVGHIGAELWAGSALDPRTRSRIVLPTAALGLLPLTLYASRPGMSLTLVALVLAGAGGAYIIGLDQWFVDAVPEVLRGRAMTLLTAGLMTIQGLGMALAGLAAEFFPVHQVVAASGVIGTLCTLLVVREVQRTGVRYRSPRRG